MGVSPTPPTSGRGAVPPTASMGERGAGAAKRRAVPAPLATSPSAAATVAGHGATLSSTTPAPASAPAMASALGAARAVDTLGGAGFARSTAAPGGHGAAISRGAAGSLLAAARARAGTMVPAGPGWSDLPPELERKILAESAGLGHGRVLPAVNRAWQEHSREPEVISRHLQFAARDLERELATTKEHQRLAHILRHTQVTDPQLRAICEHVRRLPKLEGNFRTQQVNAAVLAAIARTFPALEALQLRTDGQLRLEHLAALAPLAHLRSLTLEDFPCDEAAAPHLLACAALTQLRLVRVTLGPHALAALAGLPRLEGVEIDPKAVPGAATALLALAAVPQLRSLGVRLPREPVDLAPLGALRALEALTLRDQVCDAAVAALALPALRALCCNACAVPQVAPEAFPAAVAPPAVPPAVAPQVLPPAVVAPPAVLPAVAPPALPPAAVAPLAPPLTDAGLAQLVAAAPLTSIALRGPAADPWPLTGTFLADLRDPAALRTLELAHCAANDLAGLAQCVHLEALLLCGTQLAAADLRTIAALPHLQRLRLERCEGLQEADWQVLAAFLARGGSLEGLTAQQAEAVARTTGT